MSLILKVKEQLKQALKSRDRLRLSVLRLLLTSLNNEVIVKAEALSEDEEIRVLTREVKKRHEAAGAYRAGGREEAALREEQEVTIIEGFLPERMSEGDVRELVQEVVVELGADGFRDVGRVMGVAMSRIRGRAEGAQVREVAEELLS